jgi:hypothetical protein
MLLQVVGFQPDLIWVKSRSDVSNSNLIDSVRGVKKHVSSSSTNVEDTEGGSNGLSSFDSDGFTWSGVNTGTGTVNANSTTYVGWSWKAGGTAVSNTVGDIASQVSANTDSGFSIVSYTGNGTAGATVGHGLGVTPQVIIVKNRDFADVWVVGHHKLNNGTNPFSYEIYLDLDSAEGVASGAWNSTSPASSVFTVGSGNVSNKSGDGIVAYCFAEVKGYSKFGSYTGNGNTDGPFVYTGFKPAFVMIKNASAGSTDWYLYDNKRGGPASGVYGNNNKFFLKPNSSAAEGNESFDMYSNGFKIKISNSFLNGSGNTLIYMAFAEQPFVTSTTNGSIPATAR